MMLAPSQMRQLMDEWDKKSLAASGAKPQAAEKPATSPGHAQASPVPKASPDRASPDKASPGREPWGFPPRMMAPRRPSPRTSPSFAK